MDGLTASSNDLNITSAYPNCSGATSDRILNINTTRTITADLICKVININNASTLFVNSTAAGNRSVLVQAENLTVFSGSKINSSGAGYLGGTAVTINGSGSGGGIGNAANNGGGGAYGGDGGKGSSVGNAGGKWYNSSFVPLEMGSGGGFGTYRAGNGGGAIKIIATNLFILNGTVDSAGTRPSPTNFCAGGGAGGSIYVTAYNLTGNGTFTANGGSGGPNDVFGGNGGGGGGGRIAVYYNTTDWTSTDFNRATVTGGAAGGSGAAAGEVGTLAFIDSDDNNAFTAKGFRWQQNDYSTSPSWFTIINLTVFNAIVSTNVTNLTINVTQTFSITNSTWNNSNSSSATTGSNLSTLYANDMFFVNSTLACWNYTVLNAANIYVDSNSKINGSGNGYPAGTSSSVNGSGPGGGVGGANAGGGGSNGGNGGISSSSYRGGYWYNSSFQPSDMGSGGGYSTTFGGTAGAGGSAVRIIASNLLFLNGSIDVNGRSSSAGGGSSPGAGGSIYVTAYNLTGNGTFTANGGSGSSAPPNSGGGGGGRIAVYYNVTNWTSTDFNRATVTGGAAGGSGAAAGEVGTLAFIDSDDNIMYTTKGFRWQQNDYSTSPSWFIWTNLTVFNANITTNVTTLTINVAQTFSITNSTWNNSNSSSSTTGSNLSTLYANDMFFVNSTLACWNFTVLNATNINIDANSKINGSGNGYLGGTSSTVNGSGPGGGIGVGTSGGGGAYGGDGGKSSVNVQGGKWYNSSFLPLDMGSGGGYATSGGAAGGAGGSAVRIVASNLLFLNGSVDSSGALTANYAGGGAGGSIYVSAYNLTGSGNFISNGGRGGASNPFGGGGGGGRIIVYYNVTNWTSTDFNRMTVAGGAGGGGTAVAGDVGTLAFINQVIDEVFSIKGFRFQSNDMITGAITHSTFNMTNSSVRFNDSALVNGTTSFSLINSNLTNTNTSAVGSIRSPIISFDATSRVNFTGRLDLTYSTSFSDINTTYGACSALTMEKENTAEISWINSSLTNLFNLSANVLLGDNYAHVNSSRLRGLNTTANITFWGITFVDPKAIWSINDTTTFVDCPSAQCKKLSYSGGAFKFNVTRFTNYSSSDNFTLACNMTLTTDVTMSQNLSSNGTCITIGADNITFNCANYVLTGNQSGVGIYSNGYSGFTIKNCRITNFSNGLETDRGLSALLLNNTMWLNTQNGTFMNAQNHTRWINNTAYNNTANGFASLDLFNATFTTNYAYNNTVDGYHLVASNSTLSLNNATQNQYGFILLTGSQNNTLTNNTAYLSAQYGFYLYGASLNNLYNNTGLNNSNAAFYLQSSSNNNTFIDNYAYNNSGFGLDSAQYNTFQNSYADSGAYGLTFTSSSLNNTFTNSTIYDAGSSGILLGGYDNRLNHTVIRTAAVWIYDNNSNSNNTVTNTTFTNANGSINILPTVTFPYNTNVSQSKLNITFNNAFLNSTNLSFFNTTGIITLTGLSFVDPFPTVDFEDDGSYITCNSSICTEISYLLGTFIYNVTHFTSYSSDENVLCGNINTSTTMDINLNSNGTCFNITADNITFDCAAHSITGNTSGYGFLVTNRQNVTIENCVISNFSRAIYSNSSNLSTYRNDTMLINQYGLYMDPSYNNSILSNSMYNNSLYGLYLLDSHYNTIFNNSIFNNTDDGLQLVASTFNNLTANSIYNNSNRAAYLESSTNNTLADNFVSNQTNQDFFLYNSSSNTFYNNTFYCNFQAIGMSTYSDYNNLTLNYAENISNCQNIYEVSYANHNTLDNNTAVAANNAGFNVNFVSSFNTLRNNNATNTGIGYYVESSDNNTLINNLAADGSSGFSVYNSNNVSLINNTALDNYYGIDVYQSSNSTFDNISIRSDNVWIRSASSSQNNSFENTTFMNYNGSIRIISKVTIPTPDTEINVSNLNISYNLTFLNSTNLSFLNTSGQITLYNLTFANPEPIVDFNDTLNFTFCNASICTEQSYSFGTFIYNVTHFTQYSSEESVGLNINMPKNTVNCTVTLDQNVSSVTLYTCGDVASIGGTIVCDTNSSGNSSATNPTNASSCDISTPDFGSFLVTNNGTDAMLNATVVNLTIDNVNTSLVYLDNYIFDAVSAPGCNNTNCNNCPAADTAGCYKDINSSSPYPDNVLECDRFTGGGGLCECFSIHIDDEDTLHLLRNGSSLSFSLTKSVVSPAQNPCI
ncbi:Periplasmic copper-binding protein (NosD) [uncultured archaeon]|nr:Periplasmic copper-binding protein (NosD) [uncultured archaeon]